MLKAILETELQVPAVNLLLLFQNRMLTDNNATCESIGIKNGDCIKIMFIGVQQSQQQALGQQPSQQQQQQPPPAPQPVNSGIHGLQNLPQTYAEIKFEDLPVDPGLRFQDLPPQIMNNPTNLRNVVLKNEHLFAAAGALEPAHGTST